ncbi:hypothetical protein VTJ83DRAFT_4455 [Remersonia thermophila]|uniref:Rhodopsin domain-containing protein n=1 Tax=Remersonia thermophila TaxID=72144 RepID=A0ABR4DA24_9PEZI
MDAFVKEAFALLGVGLFVIGLRLCVRVSAVGVRRLQADDYLMVLAAILYSVETYLAYTVGVYWKGLANNGMTDEQRRSLNPSSEEYRLRVNGSKTQIAGWSTYTLLLWVIKAAMCAFYLRLMDGLGYEKRVYFGLVAVTTTWIAVILSIMLGCRPFEKNWQIYPDPGNACQPAISKIDIFVTVVLNVLTDIYLMSIPIPMLLASSLRPLKKAGLCLLFSGGIFVTVAAILRSVLIIMDPINGAQQAGSWAVRETFVAVVTSNLPMITPLIARFFRPIIGTFRSLSASHRGGLTRISRSRDGHGRAPAGGSGLFVLEDKNPRRGMGPRSVHPIPDVTMNGSDENIFHYHYSIQHDDGQSSGSTAAATPYDTDLEAARAAIHSRGKGGGGVIVKQTSVEVIESPRRLGEGDDVGDYYLFKQSRREAERVTRQASTGRSKRSSGGWV